VQYSQFICLLCFYFSILISLFFDSVCFPIMFWSTLISSFFPYTTLFRSAHPGGAAPRDPAAVEPAVRPRARGGAAAALPDAPPLRRVRVGQGARPARRRHRPARRVREPFAGAVRGCARRRPFLKNGAGFSSERGR